MHTFHPHTHTHLIRGYVAQCLAWHPTRWGGHTLTLLQACATLSTISYLTTFNSPIFTICPPFLYTSLLSISSPLIPPSPPSLPLSPPSGDSDGWYHIRPLHLPSTSQRKSDWVNKLAVLDLTTRRHPWQQTRIFPPGDYIRACDWSVGGAQRGSRWNDKITFQRFLSPKGNLKVAGLLSVQYVKIKSR